MNELAAIVVGFAAGAVAGLMGIGGGVLFVPALAIFLDKPHVEAEATSLVAIVPVAIVGTWRQMRYGNVRLADGIWIGLLSLVGAVVGAVIANALPQRALEVGFALLILGVALRLAREALVADDQS